jgi:hypothetical protein
MMYVQDYDESYPMTANYGEPTPSRSLWSDLVASYLKNRDIFKCPTAVSPGFPNGWAGRGYAAIGMNTQLAFVPPTNGTEAAEGFGETLSRAAVDEPDRFALVTETPNAPVGGAMGRYRGHSFDPCVASRRAAIAPAPGRGWPISSSATGIQKPAAPMRSGLRIEEPP